MRDHVDAQLKETRSMGVTGVPYFLFKSGGVSGAQPLDVLLQCIEEDAE